MRATQSFTRKILRNFVHLKKDSWFRVKFAGPRASATASRATPTCQPRRGWPASSAGKHVSPWWRRAPRPPPRGRPPRCSRRVARCRPSSARPLVCFLAPIAGSPRRVWPVPRPRPPRAASPALTPRQPRGRRPVLGRLLSILRPRWRNRREARAVGTTRSRTSGSPRSRCPPRKPAGTAYSSPPVSPWRWVRCGSRSRSWCWSRRRPRCSNLRCARRRTTCASPCASGRR